jgi:hypothetical protein
VSIIYIPGGNITNAEVSDTAAIAASKLVHHFIARHSQGVGTAVVTSTEVIHVAKAAGTVAALRIGVVTAPTGGNKQFTVDVKKSTGAGAFTSILSAAYAVDNTKANLTTYSGVIGTATYAAGDIFEIVVTASGSTGTQGWGVCANVFFQEPTS